MRKIYFCLTIISLFGIFSCTTEKQLKDQVAKLIKENPEIITTAIEENPVKFMDAFQKAASKAKGQMAKKRESDEKKKMEETFENPLKPKLHNKIPVRGDRNAPLVLIEYSDFECPYCTRGFQTVQDLREKYGNKLQFIYKHLPLSFHPQAMISAQYFEAIALQNSEKAFKFHDEIFKNQSKLKKGEPFLKSIATKLGVNMKKLAKDIKSKVVADRIAEDQKEAMSFGIQGTPGFLINGVPVKGAYPASHFTGIIEELKKRGKIKI